MARISQSSWIVLFAGLGGVAMAAGDPVSDSDLISRAEAVLASKEAPADRILGIHHGLPVLIDIRCGDVCPAYTVRILHYPGQAEAACAQTGGDIATVDVPKSITYGPEKFCIPHILFSRKRFTDKPFQR